MKGRPGTVTKITVRLGDQVMTLEPTGGSPAAEICREVRGVVLSRQPVQVGQWAAELAKALVGHARAERRDRRGAAPAGRWRLDPGRRQVRCGCSCAVGCLPMRAHSGEERLGPYRLRERLGEGGMGMVYLAADPHDRPVAVKVLRQGVPAEATARHRLAREVETMRRIHSPFVAEVVDADVEGSPPYIVTRYVAGRTLEDLVTADGPLTGAALARLASGLAAALTDVHAAGVVHRDLKPGNVMLVDGEPVVIDFGIAQALDSTRLTMTGMFMGTPGYLAPEVIEGKPSGPAADVHSWAATMAYAATGRPPFGTGQFEAIFYRIVHGQPELDCMPAPLLPIVLAALARDPSQRPCAADLAGMAAALNPETLVPAPPGAARHALSAAATAGELSSLATRTALDMAPPPPAGSLQAAQAPTPAWPGTRPIALPVAAAAKDNYADLLPPVRYRQDPAMPGTLAPGSAQPGSPLPGPGRPRPCPGQHRLVQHRSVPPCLARLPHRSAPRTTCGPRRAGRDRCGRCWCWQR